VRAVDVWGVLADERRALADELAALDGSEWAVPSLCGAWTTREVLGHLVVPLVHSTGDIVRAGARALGRFDRANEALARAQAVRPVEDLLDDLRRHADHRFHPPGFGPEAPLTDLLLHAQDIRVPLGRPSPVAPARYRPVLDLLSAARSAVIMRRRPPRLRLEATDLDWSHGDGPTVTGRAEDLALSLGGRSAVVDQLAGDGHAALVAWLAR
jgi:uncharacterized protein (TIGR03083 family)